MGSSPARIANHMGEFAARARRSRDLGTPYLYRSQNSA
jgi:hypothetical protein